MYRFAFFCLFAVVASETTNWNVAFANNGGCGCGTGGCGATTPTRQTFVIGTEDTYPPYSTTANGVVEGLSIDLIQAAAAAGGCDVEMMGLIWPDCLRSGYPVEPALTSNNLAWYLGPAMKQGQIQGCASTGIVEARKMVVNYSKVYAVGPSPSIIVPAGSGLTLANLNSITWVEGTFSNNGLLNNFQAGLAAQIGTQTATAGNANDAIAKVTDGTFQAAIISSNNIPTSGWTVLSSISGTPFGVSVPKGAAGKALIACLNPGIDQILANGVAANICQQWVAKANGVAALTPDCTNPNTL